MILGVSWGRRGVSVNMNAQESPLDTGDSLQDPQWVSEAADGTELRTYVLTVNVKL